MGKGLYKEPPELKLAKTPEQRIEWGIRQWQKKMEDEVKTRDFSKLSPTNPYKLNYAAAAGLPQLKDNFVTKFIQDFAVGGKMGTNIAPSDQIIFNAAVAEVMKNPKNAAAIATQIQDFYILGMKNQRLQQSTVSMGLPYVGNYPVRLEGSEYSTGKRGVEMMSAVQIQENLMEAAITKMGSYASGRGSQIMQGMSPRPIN